MAENFEFVWVRDTDGRYFKALRLTYGATQSLVVPYAYVLDSPTCLWVQNKDIEVI